MKATKVLLGAASYLIAAQLLAGEAIFYITEEGSAVRDLAVSVNGQKKLVGASGFVSFDIAAGNYRVELSRYGEYVGEFDFSTSSTDEHAEIQVELIGGEAMPEINLYTPGQETAPALGQLSGFIQSSETGGGVAGASIVVSGTETAVVTDGEGYFSIELPRGDYALTIAHPNYGKRDVKSVRVMGSVNTGLNLTLSMSGDGMIEEVVAVGSYIPSTATAQQRDSTSVLNAIGAEQLARFGDSSAASALKRVAGVSVVGGQFAVVRGLQGRYISSTLNGSLMPSTDPMRRDVPLDLFPASVLGGINIQKSYTPDLPGDTTGGAIMMETKGLPDEQVRKLGVSGALNTRTTFNDVNGYSGGGSDWTGMDDGTRELPASLDSLTNGGRSSLTIASDCTGIRVCVSPSEAAALAKEFSDVYAVDQVTAAPDFGASYAQGNRYDFRDGQVGYYAALEYDNGWENRHKGKLDDLAVAGTYERSKRKIDVTGYFTAGYEDADTTLNSKTILLRKTEDTVRTSDVLDDAENRRVESTLLEWVERQFIAQQFSGEHILGSEAHQVDWRIDVGQTSRNEPDRRSYRRERDILIIPAVERRYSDLTEDSLALGVDYTFNTPVFDAGDLKLKTGVMATSKERTVNLGRFGFTAANGGPDTTQSVEDVLSDANIDADLLRLQTRTTITDSYTATDDIAALYGMAELDLNSWSMMGGVRVEDSEQALNYPDKPSAESVLASTDILPALSLNWRVTEDTQIRFGLSQTLSRPGLTERSESSQYDPETDRELIGNPALVISKITNADIRAEYYFSDEESISVAVFAKDIKDPIERGIPDASGSSASGLTFRNEDSASVYGVEIDFRRNVIDSNSYSGFVAGNFSYINAEVTLSIDSARQEQIEKRKLQGQSEYLINMQFGVDHLVTGQSITLMANYFDDRIYAAGRGIAPEIEDGRILVDLVYQWDIDERLNIKSKVNNITDEKVSFSRAGSETESYYQGASLSASVDWSF